MISAYAGSIGNIVQAQGEEEMRIYVALSAGERRSPQPWHRALLDLRNL